MTKISIMNLPYFHLFSIRKEAKKMTVTNRTVRNKGSTDECNEFSEPFPFHHEFGSIPKRVQSCKRVKTSNEGIVFTIRVLATKITFESISIADIIELMA